MRLLILYENLLLKRRDYGLKCFTAGTLISGKYLATLYSFPKKLNGKVRNLLPLYMPHLAAAFHEKMD